MTSPSVITGHHAEAFTSDPRRALVAVRDLLDDDLPWLERRAVLLARRDGRSWGEIVRALDRSRQAVRQRYLAVDGRPPPLPRRPLRDDERAMTGWYAHLADLRRRDEFSTVDDIPAW